MTLEELQYRERRVHLGGWRPGGPEVTVVLGEATRERPPMSPTCWRRQTTGLRAPWVTSRPAPRSRSIPLNAMVECVGTCHDNGTHEAVELRRAA